MTKVLFNKKKPFWKRWAEDLGSECHCAFHRRYGYVQFFNFDEAWISRSGSRLGSGTEYYGGVLSVAKQGFNYVKERDSRALIRKHLRLLYVFRWPP